MSANTSLDLFKVSENEGLELKQCFDISSKIAAKPAKCCCLKLQ
jgi:hypothetical protein